VSRVIKPISIRDEEHEILLGSAKALGVSLKDYVESVLVVYIAKVKTDKGIQFMVPQKANAAKPFAMSTHIGKQVKDISETKGVSQVNFIYSAFMWHISEINGVLIA
jgi:hypothetical protein